MLLRKSLPADALARCAVAVFGLGDSGYPKYNVTAKKLDRRLEALGAQRLLPLGLGDDQARSQHLLAARARARAPADASCRAPQHPLGYEASLESWAAGLWAALRALCPLPQGAPSDPAPGAELPPPPLRLRATAVPGAPPPPQMPPPGEPDSDAEVAACVAAAAALDALLAGAGAPAVDAARHSAAQPCLARVACNERLTAADHSQARAQACGLCLQPR